MGGHDRRWARAAPVAALLALGATACSSSTTSPPSASRPPPSSVATSSATTSSPTGSGSTGSGAVPHYEVRTATIKGLGTVLVDGQGFTLYLFEPDKQSGTSTCYGSCASGWPPLYLPTGVSKPLAGPGVNAALLGTTARTDGTTEITYDKWPLYLWVGDSEPGQATGQGLDNLGGLWYVVSPDGKAITSRVATSS